MMTDQFGNIDQSAVRTVIADLPIEGLDVYEEPVDSDLPEEKFIEYIQRDGTKLRTTQSSPIDLPLRSMPRHPRAQLTGRKMRGAHGRGPVLWL